MANFSTWSKGVPSGASLQREFDDLYRSDKSILEATLNTEHYYTSSSATSAGVHRLGSARVYMGARSALSVPTDGNGRLMYCSDTSSLHVMGASSATTLFSPGLGDDRYVLKSRDTLTGILSVTSLIATSQNTVDEGGQIMLEGAGSFDDWYLDTVSGTARLHSNSTAYFSVSTLGPFYSGQTIWHAGNDGASSGLDADTVDTFHIYSGTSAIAATGISAGGDAQVNIPVSSGTTGAPVFLGYYDSGAVISSYAQCHGTTVIAIFHNPTASTVTLPAQTITARVIR